MRVLLLHNRYAAYSGEEAALDRLEGLLARHGHEVRRYERDSARLTSALDRVGALFASLFGLRARRELSRLLSEFQPDVVHVHNLFPLISPAVLPMIAKRGFPLVMTLHNYRLICPTGLFYSHGGICERCDGGREWACALRNCTGSRSKSLAYALRNAWARKRGHFTRSIDRFICLTEFQRRRLDDGSGRFSVLSNSLEPAPDPAPPGDYIGYVGRISEEKGAELLLEACARLPERRFVLAGACAPGYRERFARLSNVSLLGPLPSRRLPAFYRGARFLLFTSRCYEGFPMVMLEAMAEARALICPALGGLPEIVADGVNGVLVPPDDVSALVSAIESLWLDPARCRALGEVARERLRQRYGEERAYRGLLDIYRQARRVAGREVAA